MRNCPALFHLLVGCHQQGSDTRMNSIAAMGIVQERSPQSFASECFAVVYFLFLIGGSGISPRSALRPTCASSIPRRLSIVTCFSSPTSINSSHVSNRIHLRSGLWSLSLPRHSLERDPISTVCAAYPTEAGRRDAAIFALQFCCGLQRSEIAALAIDHYFPESR